jgi:hypothetical protein
MLTPRQVIECLTKEELREASVSVEIQRLFNKTNSTHVQCHQLLSIYPCILLAIDQSVYLSKHLPIHLFFYVSSCSQQQCLLPPI